MQLLRWTGINAVTRLEALPVPSFAFPSSSKAGMQHFFQRMQPTLLSSLRGRDAGLLDGLWGNAQPRALFQKAAPPKTNAYKEAAVVSKSSLSTSTHRITTEALNQPLY